MAFRIFDAEGRVGIDDDTGRGLQRVAGKVRETMARVDQMEGTAQLKADATQLDKEIERTRQKLRSVDRQRATAHADMDAGAFDVAEKKLQQKIKALQRERVEIDVRMGRDLKLMDRTLVGVVRRLREVGRVTPWQDVQRLGNALHNARITLGPLSLSLRGLIVAMLTLAPIVTALTGAVGGLSATIGLGVVGAVGLGGAAILGFGALLGGVVGAVIAHKDQFNKFGHALRMVGAEFKKQTRIPTSFFNAIREGIQTLRRDLPIMTTATNTALNTIGRSFKDFFISLRTGSFKDALKQLFGNANEALGPLLRGFNALGRAAVNIGASFSRHLPGVARTFRDWSRGVESATRNTKSLDNTVDELFRNTKSLGNFLKAGADLVVAFFEAGGPSGRRMLRDITGLLNKWTEWLESKEGQKKVKDFLDDAWETTKKIADVLEETVELIKNLASAGKPVVDWLLEAADNALELFNNLEDSTGAGDELVTGLAGLIILRRAVGWASSLMAILGGGIVLKGLKGLGKGLLTKILFPGGAAAVGTALGASFRTVLSVGLRGAGIAGAAFLVGELAGTFRRMIGPAFDSAGVPDVIKRAFQTAFDFSGPGQLASAVEAIKHPIDTLKRAWENLGRLPGVKLVATFVDRVRGPALRVFNAVRGFFRRGAEMTGRFIDDATGAARTAYNRAKAIFNRGIALTGRLIDSVTGAARAVFGRAKAIFNRGIALTGSLIDDVTGAARSVFNRAKGIFARGVSLTASLIDNITSAASSIMAAAESIFHDIVVNVTVKRPNIGGLVGLDAQGGVHGVTGYASGGRSVRDAGEPVTARMMEQAMQMNSKRRDGGKVFSPQFINSFNIAGEELGNSEFVIPTNPAYRRRARMLLSQAASVIGTGFAKGVGSARRRGPRRKKVYSGSHYLMPVRTLEEEIQLKDNALTVYDNRYQTDARFKPMLDDNGQRIEANISWHIETLADLERRATDLSKLEMRLSKAIDRAHRMLRNAMDRWQKRRPPATIVKGKGDNRKRVDNPEFKRWADKMNGLRSAFGEVPMEDAQQAVFRSDDYASQAYSYKADQREARETKSAPLASLGLEGWLAQNGMLGTLQQLNLGVAKAAATIGNATDDQAAYGSLASFYESVITKLGPSGDTELLTDAYNALASAKEGASAGFSSTPDIGIQTQAFNEARDALFREFGSNFFGSSGGGGILGAMMAGGGVVSGLSGGGGGGYAAQGGTSGGGTAEGSAGTTINQTNNFAAPPPDPHTFVKSTMWEAQAA